MNSTIICIEQLSKQYQTGNGSLVRYKTFREAISTAVTTPLHRVRRLLEGQAATDSQETIWALKDVSLEINRGEVVGIIGRNGAGKSTLLKIMARITEPTKGTVDLYGRVGSLLEIGTGFHPELTGRENTFLYGAILGMKRAEIQRKFDEIVDFAEVHRFIDTPVKHYSSGMYMRLAFAVAAHLETEILLVDEVLAVGDIAFQQKCLGKMDEVAHAGRTILFVSHNIAAVKKLCTHAVHLANGQIKHIGEASTVCNEYLREIAASGVLSDRTATAEIEIKDQYGANLEEWKLGEQITIQVAVRALAPIESPAVDIALYSPNGVKVIALQSDKFAAARFTDPCEQFTLAFRLTNPGISVTELYLDVGVRTSSTKEYLSQFRQARVIPIFLADLAAYSRTDAIIYLPAEVHRID